MATADDFDPYLKWLGIPPAEQPPNHYRLLSVPLFESDAATIAKAAGRWSAYLDARSKGKNGALAQRLLDEVIAAQTCLLDAASKVDYDANLQASLRGSDSGAPPAKSRTSEAMAEAREAPIVEAVIEPSHDLFPDEGQGRGEAAAAAAPKPAAKPVAKAPAKPAKPAAVQQAPADEPHLEPAAVGHDAPSDGGFFDGFGISGIGLLAKKKASAGAAPEKQPAKPTPAAAVKANTKVKAGATAAASSAAWSPSKTAAKGKKSGQLPGWMIPACIGGGLGFLLLVVGVVYMFSGGEPEQPKQNTNVALAANDGPRQFGPQSVDLLKVAQEQAKKKPLGGRTSSVIPMRQFGNFFVVDAVSINGKPAGAFLIDTGAAATAIKSSVAEKLGLSETDRPQRIRAVGGAQTATFRKTERLLIGDAHFDNLNVVVIDLTPWEKATGAKFDGVIGCDVWRELFFEIDPEKKELTFFDRDQNRLITDSKGAEFLTVMDDRPFIGVTVNGGSEVQYMAATGCGHELEIKPENADLTGGKVDPESAAEKAGSVALLGKTFEDLSTVTARADDVYVTSDPRQIGVVGAPVLSKYKIFMDFQRNKMLVIPLKSAK